MHFSTVLSTPLLSSSPDHSAQKYPTNSSHSSRGFLSSIAVDVNVAASQAYISENTLNTDDLVLSSSLISRGSRFQSLSWRLGHFDYLLDALNELRSEFFTASGHLLPDSEICLSAATIMDLLEIGKDTLEEAGVDLWPHSLCVVGLRYHKKAYFTLLKLLRSRADCLDPQQQARSRRFTCRLFTNFSIRINPAYDLYLPPKPRNAKQKFVREQSSPQQKLFRSMPPPDAFPQSDFTPVFSRSFLGPRRCRRRMRLEFSSEVWESLELEPPSRPTTSPYNITTHSRHNGHGIRVQASDCGVRTKQRFGIFCTGKAGSLTNMNCKGSPLSVPKILI